MPLYEYQCQACGRRFELIRKFSDPPLDKCPHCGGAVSKLFSSPAIQFKGSGFYITDYAKKDQASPSSSGDAKGDTAATTNESGEKAVKGEKAEKTDTAPKAETSQKSDKVAATEKAAKPETKSST